MDKCHFTIVIGLKEHGLYVSSTPSSASKSKKVVFYLRKIVQKFI
jgi:hypothetical protein